MKAFAQEHTILAILLAIALYHLVILVIAGLLRPKAPDPDEVIVGDHPNIPQGMAA